MAFVIADRVRETTTTTGTGSVTLAGAYISFQSFSAAIGNGNSTYYTIANPSAGEWEVGIGTYTSGTNTLSRDTVLASSASGAKVTLSSGSKDVFVTQPAERSLLVQSAGSGLFAGNAAFTANGVLYADSTTTTATGSTLTFNGTTLSTNGLTATGTTTLSGGTANGVAYLNGSKVVTTGSALTFDGTNFGIGGSASGSKLHVMSAGGVSTKTENTLNTGATYFQAKNTAGSTVLGQDNVGGYLLTDYAAPILFYINNSEQMRLTSTGLGIGTSSPSEKLTVAGAGLFTGALANYRTSSAAIDWFNGITRIWAFGANSSTPGTVQLLTSSNNGSVINTLTYDTSGNLGLGVTPSAWISSGKAIDIAGFGSVAQTSSGSLASTFNAYQNSAGNWIYKTTNAAAQYQCGLAGLGQHAWYTAPSGTAGNAITFTQAMTLTAAGRLGLGLTSPSTLFEAYGGAAGTSSELTVGNASTAARFGVDTSNEVTVATGQAVPIKFLTSNTERARIDSSGNLGLGGTSSSSGITIAKQYGGVNITGGGGTYAQWGGGYGMFPLAGVGLGIASQAAMTFLVNNTSTQAMTLDASGNLGIGTTSPGARIHLKQSGANVNGLYVEGSANDSQVRIYNNGTVSGISSTYGSTGSYMPLVFLTSDTERARIDSSGNLLVGDTGSVVTTGVLRVKETGSNYIARLQSTGSSAPQGLSIYYSGAAPNGTGSPFLFCEDSGALRMSVRSNGGIANYSANDVNLSDRREKTNFAPAREYLSKICAIPVQTFNYIDQSEDDPGLTLGVVAQDVQAVAPELVMESNWGSKDEPKMRLSIYQTDLQYALMKCIQEQQAIIEQLKADVAALKGN